MKSITVGDQWIICENCFNCFHPKRVSLASSVDYMIIYYAILGFVIDVISNTQKQLDTNTAAPNGHCNKKDHLSRKYVNNQFKMLIKMKSLTYITMLKFQNSLGWLMKMVKITQN